MCKHFCRCLLESTLNMFQKIAISVSCDREKLVKDYLSTEPTTFLALDIVLVLFIDIEIFIDPC